MTNQSPNISVIVPIYNVEKYLDSCLKAILEQSFSDLEIILVDDGSTDQCPKLCDKYKNKDERITVVHKSNGGLSSARNAGIEKANGKYIVFIDPDDQIHQDYFIKLFNIIDQNNCDVVVSGYRTVPQNNTILPKYEMNKILNGKEFVLSHPNVHSSNDLCFVWRYIYRLQIIKENEIRFNEKVFIGEDVIFNLEFLLKSNRAFATSEVLYDYTVNNPDSLMRVSYKPKLESSLVIQYRLRKHLSEKFGLLSFEHYRKDMASYYISNIYNLMISNLKNSSTYVLTDDIKRIVNYSMIRESLKEVGFKYKCTYWKEYIYYLALKFRIYPLILKRL